MCCLTCANVVDVAGARWSLCVVLPHSCHISEAAQEPNRDGVVDREPSGHQPVVDSVEVAADAVTLVVEHETDDVERRVFLVRPEVI